MKSLLSGLFAILLTHLAFANQVTTNNFCLDTTLTILILKNKTSIDYLLQTNVSLITEKSNLLHKINFSMAPSFNINNIGSDHDFKSINGIRDFFSMPLKCNLEIGDWQTFLDINPIQKGYNNNAGVLIPVFTTKSIKAKLLDTLIMFNQQKSYYQIEKLFLQDLKNIWQIVITIQQIEKEIQFRNQVNHEIDSTCIFLTVFSNSGLINKRIMHLLMLTSLDNTFQTNLLLKRVQILKSQLNNQYSTRFFNINLILQENIQFLNHFDQVDNAFNTNKKVQRLEDCIDSLNMYEIIKRKEFDTYSDIAFKIGPTLSTPGNLQETSLGASAQFTISLIADKNKDIKIRFNPSPLHLFWDSISSIDTGSVIELKQYMLSIDNEIVSIIEELKSGIQYSLYTLNELYSRKITAQISSNNMWHTSLTYKISCIHNLEEIGLRSNLINIISGNH